MSVEIRHTNFAAERHFLREAEREMFIDSEMARADEPEKLNRLVTDLLNNNRNKVERAQGVSFCAFEGDQPVGYVFASVNGLDQSAFIMSVYVAPEYRRQGIGRTLLEKLLTHLTDHAIHKVGLAVTVTNERALRLYESLGFEIKRHVMRRTHQP